MQQKHNKGFILVYTVLILSVMVLTAGIFADTVMKEVAIARDEGESLKAFYAADAGIECIRYLQNEYEAFNPTSPQTTYNCGVGSNFQAGGNPLAVPARSVPAAQCVADTRTFTVAGFSNGACTRMTIQIIPRTITVNGVPTVVCDVEVISDGRNRCTTSGMKLVERTRWETM